MTQSERERSSIRAGSAIGSSSRRMDGRNLEQRVADYFRQSGYEAMTNIKQEGRSGAVHEIDVLAVRRDAAGTHRVVVECKAWRNRIEKDVVYKLDRVMNDLGLSKGIVVALSGLTSGARLAARDSHVEVWEQDEIRHTLGDEALAGAPISTPDQALGRSPAITRDEALRQVKKARRLLGGEEVAAVDLVWVPAVEFGLAVNRIRPGLVKDRDEVIRRWNIYEQLTGMLLGEKTEPRGFSLIDLEGAVLRPQRSASQIRGFMGRVLEKHRNARSEAATKARQVAYNNVGLPGSATNFAVEAQSDVYLPFYVGSLKGKGTERLVAIHAEAGFRLEKLERALQEKIDIVKAGIDERNRPQAEPAAPAQPERLAANEVKICACGNPMVLRHRRSDAAPFWGCSTFPKCRHTAPAG